MRVCEVYTVLCKPQVAVMYTEASLGDQVDQILRDVTMVIF